MNKERNTVFAFPEYPHRPLYALRHTLWRATVSEYYPQTISTGNYACVKLHQASCCLIMQSYNYSLYTLFMYFEYTHMQV